MAKPTPILHGSWIEDENGAGKFVFWGEQAAAMQAESPPAGDGSAFYPPAFGTRERDEGNRYRYGYGNSYSYQYDTYLLYRYPDDVAHFINWGRSSNALQTARPHLSSLYVALPDCEGKLGGWRIVGLNADAISTLQVLLRVAALPAPTVEIKSPFALLPHFDYQEGYHRHRVGWDLLYWAQAARLLLELLGRGHFLPGLSVEEDNWRAEWLVPELTAADDAARFTALVEAMPPACRALAYDQAQLDAILAGESLTGSELLARFLSGMADGLVRQLAAADRNLRPKANGEARQWLTNLYKGQPEIVRGNYPELIGGYAKWAGAELDPDTRHRVAVRLEPPTGTAEDAEHDEWRLIFLLQAQDDPSLQIPASTIWYKEEELPSDLLPGYARRKLLTALGEAATAFTPIARALSAPDPTVMLNIEEAYNFLRFGAAQLERLGITVIVPNWWQRRPAVKAQLSLQPQGMEPSGLFSLSSLIRYNWQVSVGGQHIDAAEFARLAELKQPLVQVRGQWVELRAEQRDAALKLLRQHGRSASLGEAVRVAMGGLDEEGAAVEAEVQPTGWLKSLLGNMKHGRLEQLPQPASFVGQLRPYQLHGYSWLAFLRRYGLGACLADDMGLGKTIQLLALLLREQEAGAAGPTLLICPTSVVGNWQREAARFAPSLRVMVHHGSGRRKGEEFAAEVQQHELVISSYNLAHRDEELLAGVQWRTVVLDEAQNIKNANAKQTRALKHIPAGHRIALTGTPVENRLAELWSIMDFLNPGYLGSHEAFRKRYALPIERSRDKASINALRKMTAPFIMRRLKTDPLVIQDLPQKNEMKVYCNLTVEQASLYEAFVKNIMEQIKHSGGMARRGLILKLLMRLKQICNHPAQFLADNSKVAGRSGKLERLGEMLDEAVSEGDKALVFTQFAEMGSLLQEYLQAGFGEVLFLHGGTPREQREQMVSRFQAEGGPSIFVLSLKAGGLGLNLTAANHVFHFDRWWNPAVENQATDRAFRIGQTRNVQVHKFICVGTLEERIDAMIESKRQLAESVIGGADDGWLTELSTDDLRELVRLSADAVGGWG